MIDATLRWIAIGCLGSALAAFAQTPPAAGANKFLGNITSRGQVRADFGQYWNQITAENEHKWSSVEGTRDRMNWAGGDRVAEYAKTAGIPWKFHTLVWGSQYPNWITGLSQTEQLQEIEEWFDEAQKRYPDLPMIDVVNEAHPNHAPAPFRNALGGNGTTGYDWIIKAFQMARQRWPNAILIYNDYNNIEYSNEVNWTVGLIDKMKEVKAPIDAIGCQAHDAYRINTATLKSNIDKLAATGLPIFITEYDVGYTDDTQQLNSVKDQFPVFWNHPSVVGVTYWGYVVGQTWRNGTGLMQSDGTERPSLAWMVDYVKQNPNPENNFPNFLKGGGTSIRRGPSLSAGFRREIAPGMRIFDLQGREIQSYFRGRPGMGGTAGAEAAGVLLTRDGLNGGLRPVLSGR
jgi:endo-1,4-beta-xylanase